MSKEQNNDALAPASSRKHSQMRYLDDPSQHGHKRHKNDGHDMNDFDSSSRAVSSLSSSSQPNTTSSSYPRSQKTNGATAGQMVKTDYIHSNFPYEGGKKVSATEEIPPPSSHPSAASTVYHHASHDQMYPTDYSRSQQMQMPYQQEHRQHTTLSYHNPTIATSQASDASSERFRSHDNREQRSSSSLKRTSSELYTSYEPRLKQNHISTGHHESSIGYHHRPRYINQTHRERNASAPFGNSPTETVKPAAETLRAETVGGAQWSQLSTSHPHYGSASHHEHHLSSHLMPDHRQPSNWYNTNSSPNMFMPPMTHYDQSHHTRSGPPVYPLNGQVPPPPHRVDQGMMASQGPGPNRQAGHPNFSQPSQQIITLALEEDESWLSEFLCFVRKHCTEVICASHDDVATRMNSKKVVLGQVGVRCVFCAHLPHKDRAGRSSTFPSSLSRIYQSLTMMIRDHFGKCSAIPPRVKERYTDLRANSSQGIDGSKQYWVDSAKKLGLIDTEDGIVFKDTRHYAARPQHWNGR